MLQGLTWCLALSHNHPHPQELASNAEGQSMMWTHLNTSGFVQPGGITQRLLHLCERQ